MNRSNRTVARARDVAYVCIAVVPLVAAACGASDGSEGSGFTPRGSDAGAGSAASPGGDGAVTPPSGGGLGGAGGGGGAGGSGGGGGPPGPGDGGATTDASPPLSACPSSPTLKPGDDKTITLAQGTTSRSYLVHVGKTVDPSGAAPLIVNVHGLNNSPQIQVGFSGMSALADQKGFVVAYPQGINASFNAGGCCGSASQNGVDDMGFIRALVADVEAKTCIDRRRVYATGFSNGGYMSYRLGCEASDVFAAVAPVSGSNASPTCNPARPVPLIAFHGDADPIVPYANGKSSAQDWAKRDACSGDPTHTTFGSSYCDEWGSCAGGAKVRFCTISGGSHLWPSGGSLVASPMIWDFFRQFTLD